MKTDPSPSGGAPYPAEGAPPEPAVAAPADGGRARPIPWPIAGVLALGVIPQALASSALAVAIPAIDREFQAGPAVTWVISGLYLATGVGAVLSGKLADAFGARTVLLCGLGLATVASIGAALAPTLGWLIVMRVLIGLGTAAPFPCALAILRAEHHRRGLPVAAGGLGAVAVAMQSTVALGPSLGGLLLSVGWRAIFVVTVPVLLIAATATWCVIPADSHRPRPPRVLAALDLPGMLTVAATITTLMAVLLHLRAGLSWYLIIGTLVQVVLLLWWSTRAQQPFLHRRLMRSPALLLIYGRNTATYLCYYLIFFGLPIWLAVRGFPAVEIGVAMLPIAVLTGLASLVSARRMRRGGPDKTLAFGSAALIVAGVGILATAADTTATLASLLLLTALCGVPAGMLSLAHQAQVLQAAPREHTGAAAGLLRTAQYVGAVVAAACLELLGVTSAGDLGATHMALLICALGALLLAESLARQLRRRSC